MAISASQIVQVLPRLLTGTGSDLVFNGLVLDSSSRLPTGAAVSFSSADAVGEYFGTESDEYTFASVYFGGYNNSQLKPSLLYFYRLTPNGAAAFVRGATLTPSVALPALKAITAGTLTVQVDGTAYTVTNVNLSSADSLAGAASLVQAALTDEEVGASVTVEYDAIQNKFIISGTTVGDTAALTIPTGTIAAAMGFAADTATVSSGANIMTAVASMNALTAKFQNFVTFTTLGEASDEDAIALAQWASAQANAGTMYLYVLWDSAAANLDATNTSVIAEQLKALNVTATCVVYPSYKIAAFIMGTAASIDWSQTNGTITFAFKSHSGLGADVTSTQDSVALLGHGLNYVGNYATRNDNFIFLYSGQMLGEWAWIDAYLNAVWLCNALQVQLMAMFVANRRIPYTEAGYALIRNNCRSVITRAINNGVINPGVTLDIAQRATLTSELGGDFADEIYNTGYYLQVLDASATARQQRITPPCNLVYTYGGAVQKLTLPAIAVV